MQTMKQCSVDDRVAIIGNGIAANLVAACVRKLVPGVTVTIIGPEDAKRPIVGESTVETSAHFLRELGLHHLLIEQQFPKYGLTYYYKEHLSNPNCRRYFVDEAPAVPPLPAFQLNRFTFDPALRGHNRKGGVEFIHGSVTSVTLRQRGGAHELEFDLAAGGSGRCRARWVVDASGRSRVLGKKLGLHRKN
jgi:flavin-dependent dehydrogenase